MVGINYSNIEETYRYDSMAEAIQDNILSTSDEVLEQTKYRDFEIVWVYEHFNGQWGYYCIIFENQEDEYILKGQSHILVDEILVQVIPIEAKNGKTYELRFGIRSGDDLDDIVKEFVKIDGKDGRSIMYQIAFSEK